MQLTPRQQLVLDYIREFVAKHQYAPTIREIADEFGITSPNGVMCHLKALEKKGHIKRSPIASRSIVLTERSCCPHCGKVLTDG